MPLTLEYKGFSIEVPDSWDDFTDAHENCDAPITIGDSESGVGVLQISPAIYNSGEDPNIKLTDLREMLGDFAINQGLVHPFDICESESKPIKSTASYHSDSDFIQVWYLSDGRSVLFVSYVCDWHEREREAESRMTAVESILFT